jgi:DNA-binding transcriptional LysR family regulator
MELRQLRYLVVLAEELHFSRAAERLGIAQPALTQQIQALERELNVTLFQRTKRSVHLTVAGRLTLEHAVRTLKQAELTALMARQAGRGEQGSIEIGFVSSAAFSGILAKTISAYRSTNAAVELRMQELGVPQQLDDLASGRLDVGYVRQPLRHAPASVTSITLLHEPIIVALPKRHPLTRQRSVAIRSLAEESFVALQFTEGVGFHAQVLELCQQRGFAPKIAHWAPQLAALASMVGAGLGLALVPASLGNLRMSDVVYRPCSDAAQETSNLVLLFRKAEKAPAVVAFLESVRRSIRAA